MRTFRLDKLVRDKVYDDMVAMRQKMEARKLKPQEFINALKEKLLEESKEFDPRDPKAADELADLLEVIETIGEELGFRFEELRDIQTERLKKRGTYKKKIFISRLNLKNNDPWVEYYAKDPKKFPEIKHDR